MLIPSPRLKLENRSLVLETWQFAPLGLNVGSTAYMALEAPAASDTLASLDLIQTIFPKDTWSDLWRIEIETFDTPGNLSSFVDLLRRRRLRVEVAEGSISTFSVYHAMTFIVSGHSYSDQFDGKSHERASLPNPRLESLELDILANFAKEIAFNNINAPRLKIKRMDEYRRMHVLANEQHLRVAEFKRDVPNSKGRSTIYIPDDVWSYLSETFGEEIDYSVLVDTKSRLARVMLFARDERRYEHVQVSIPAGQKRELALQEFLAALAGRGLNISRFQVRRGSSRKMREYEINEKLYSRLDLTIDSREKRGDEIIGAVVDALQLESIQKLGIKFIRSRSFVGDKHIAPNLRWQSTARSASRTGGDRRKRSRA